MPLFGNFAHPATHKGTCNQSLLSHVELGPSVCENTRHSGLWCLHITRFMISMHVQTCIEEEDIDLTCLYLMIEGVSVCWSMVYPYVLGNLPGVHCRCLGVRIVE